MLTLEAAVQAALIAGVVSLTVVLLNTRSLRESRQDEHRRRRQDWFLEKQARDAEEIVATLDGFLKDLSRDMEALDSITGMAVDYSAPYAYDFASETPENIQRLITDESKVSKQTMRTAAAHIAWFTYDARRLCVWFEPTAKVDGYLDALSELFRAFHDSVGVITFSVAAYAGTAINNSVDVVAEKQEIAGEIKEQLAKVRNNWERVANQTIYVQRILVGHLRD